MLFSYVSDTMNSHGGNYNEFVCDIHVSHTLLKDRNRLSCGLFVVFRERGSMNTIPRSADEIPGETMGMLADRIRKYLHVCGVEIGEHDAGRILAAYATYANVRLDGLPGTEPALMGTMSMLLNAFFGESAENLMSPYAVFRIADDNTPDYLRTEVEAAWSGVKYGQPHCGVGAETFRGILREAEDDFFLPESDWRAVDAILKESAPNWVPGTVNRTIRGMEMYSSTLLATGTGSGEALDRAIYTVLLPSIFQHGGGESMKIAERVFREVFGERELPMSLRYLRVHKPIGDTSNTQ